MNDNSTILAVRDLVVRHGDRRVVDHVTFDLHEGESVAILGPSGCGKSTLLRHVVGLARPADGAIELLGCAVVGATDAELRECRLNIGMLFQSGALIGSLTVGENVALPLREHTKRDDATIRALVRMKLSQVNLAGREDALPCELSGGEAKRAALARALALSPKLLLFDEPSAGLDPITAADLDRLILYLRDKLRATILVVTHELASVEVIASRVLMLREGRVAAEGTLEHLRETPDPWVQRFLRRRANGSNPAGTAATGAVTVTKGGIHVDTS